SFNSLKALTNSLPATNNSNLSVNCELRGCREMTKIFLDLTLRVTYLPMLHLQIRDQICDQREKLSQKMISTRQKLKKKCDLIFPKNFKNSE
ncbi:MAG: hypothetical protein Q8834_02905, partial [Candidatus Phytoplasma australasiaticum]|nr:hypothetical protein [Candidatus Phytoplasma australasiaticum]